MLGPMLRRAGTMHSGNLSSFMMSTKSVPSTSSAASSLTMFSRRMGSGGGKDLPDPLPPAKAGPDGDVPSIFDQATGLERAEIEYPDLFKHNEVLRGPFGTEQNPVKIQSFYDSRIVGCTGHNSPNDHDIVWLVVEKGEKAECPECGQIFELDPMADK